MSRQVISNKKLPDTPGVYFFLGRNKKVLYIGRATSLKSRVRSYFNGRLAQTRSQWIEKMAAEAVSVDVRQTDSVLEAILLEADLIKKFQPPYNTDEKDDKSFNCIIITKEAFPRVLIARKKDLDFDACKLKTLDLKLKTIHGPFPHGLQVKLAMKIIRRIFPWRDDKCVPCPEQRKLLGRHSNTPTNVGISCRACFNRQIGLCPGVCTGEINTKDYAKRIRHLQMFLSGKKSRILKELQAEMKRAAKVQRFEEASEYKRRLFALQHIQDVALLKRESDTAKDTSMRIEAYDLSHFGGTELVGAMTVVWQGIPNPAEYRLFKLRSITGPNEASGLREVIRRRFAHPEWVFPSIIVVDGNEIQKSVAEAEIASAGLRIPVIAVVKDSKHRPRELIGDSKIVEKYRRECLLANSEAHRFVLNFQRKRQRIA